MTYEQFCAELDALCPILRAKAVARAIDTLPIGTRVAGYVREPGKDRWRCEYTSIRRRRDGSSETVQHRSYTGGWSLAMDVGFYNKRSAGRAEAIARLAYRVMVTQGLTRLPDFELASPAIVEPVFLPAPPPQPAPAAPKRAQLAFAF